MGRLQSGNVESLRGSHTEGAVAARLLAERCIRAILRTRTGELAVYLVGYDEDLVAHTDVVDALHLIACPYTSSGVVRVAEEEEAHLRVGTLSLEGFPVDGVSAFLLFDWLTNRRAVGERYHFIVQGTIFHDAPLVAYAREEAVVDRRQQQYLVAWQSQSAHDGREGRNDSCRHDHLVGMIGLDVVLTDKPVDHSLFVAIRHMGISEHAMLHPAAQCLRDGGIGAEVHVGHPEGDDVGWGVMSRGLQIPDNGRVARRAWRGGIPLHAVGAAARDDFVEVVGHFI